MSTEIILLGALGRMGREIAGLALADTAFSISGAIEYENHPAIGTDYGISLGNKSLGIPIASTPEDIAGTPVIIDFSSPHSIKTCLPIAAEKNMPYLLCTTGISDADKEFAASFSDKIPVLISPNTSLGVNLLFLLTEFVSARLKNDYDIEIIEAHHRFKKDAPSGTAKRLGEIVADSLGMTYNECIKDGREGISSTERSKKEVGMHAVRGGDIVGDHTVLFAGIGERIELKHMAHSRSTFAKGALLAARWLANQKNGHYSMRDMLGL